MEFAGLHEKVKHALLHRLPAVRRRGVELGECAGISVDRDAALDLVDEVEGIDGERRSIGHLAGVEDHFKTAGHRLAAHDERMEVVLPVHGYRGARPRSKAS